MAAKGQQGMAWTELAELLACERADTVVAYAPAMRHDDFVRQVLSIAGSLQSAGIRQAGLCFEDAGHLAVALFACWRAGTVAVLASDARPPSCAAIDPQVDLWLTDHPALPVPDNRRTDLATLDGNAPALPPIVLDPQAAGVVLWTSGSSGQPKPIRKRWMQLAAEVDALEQVWRWSDTPACVLGSVSAQHMYGLPFRVLWPLCAGRGIARTQLAFPEVLQQASLPHAAFVWIASPALLKRLGERLSWAALSSGLRQIFSAGGPLPGPVSDLLAARLGCRPTEIYGSSETGAVAWRQGGAAWRPLPGVAIGVQQEVQQGALWVRSAWADGDDRFQTSDAATLDDAGFHLQGRLDRIVKIEEKRIALPGLEQRLMEHPYVREARLGLGEMPRLTALVALGPAGVHRLRNHGRKAVIDALRAHMAAAVQPLGVPRHWRLMDELPWNAQGKLPQGLFLAASRRPRRPATELAGAPLPAGGAPTGGAPTDDTTRELRLRLAVPLDLAQFNGHFPETPVVPGVVQIEWAMNLARRHLCPTLGFHGMEALKFQRLLRPGDRVDLVLTWHLARAKLYFEYRLAGQPCSSGRILIGPQDATPPRAAVDSRPTASIAATS
jgi:acyl-coenzyme A synthetase/AMP-(fatty) acid ligase